MKLLRTNSKEYRKNIESYIFNCINSEDKELLTLEDKVNYAMEEFDRVSNYPYNMNKLPNNQDRLKDYLQGLPFDFAYSNYDILIDCAKLHNIDKIPTEKEDIIINNWFNQVAKELLRLSTKFKIY